MASIPFKQVDVFTNVRFKGNPVAVVLDSEGISSEQMQQIANWTNLSETTFVLRPTDGSADYQVRIFTPNSEIPFAGHPTIGTAHALLEAGIIHAKENLLVQQCGVGLVKLHVTYGSDGAHWISFELPEPKLYTVSKEQQLEIEESLGRPLKPGTAPRLVDVGPRWLVAQLPNAQEVLKACPDLQRMKANDHANGYTGIVVFGEYPADADADIEVRAFAPAFGVNEDPVCGSGNGSVAAFIRATSQTEKFGSELIASQGVILGRSGLLRLSISDDRILVGGQCVTCIDGALTI